MIRLATLAFVIALSALTVRAQSGPPVILLHGINASDLTWQATTDALQADGYGTPYTVHADLNASADTDLESDVVLSALVPTASDALSAPLRDGGPPALDTRLFLVNFEAVYRGDTLAVHIDRDEEGRSESNESGILKQGYALGQVIADVLAATGESRVILVGHSMGGLAIREYLQRTDADGDPRWWVDPDAEGGHRVQAVVTYGTPHQGSNATNLSTSIGSGSLPDGRSEATRDLRYSYRLTSLGQGRYLYGGVETPNSTFFSMDVDADGDEGDLVIGLNAGDNETPYAVDNPAMPLPLDVDYTYIVGDVFGFGGDVVVDADRQVLQRRLDNGDLVLVPEGRVERIVTGKSHVEQTSDAETIRAALAQMTSSDDTPAPQIALRVGPNPVADRLTIRLDLPAPAAVQISVVDALGREVARLTDGSHPAGPLRADWRANVASGAYAVVVEMGEERWIRRVTVVR